LQDCVAVGLRFLADLTPWVSRREKGDDLVGFGEGGFAIVSAVLSRLKATLATLKSMRADDPRDFLSQVIH
jgi:hypothetical protein